MVNRKQNESDYQFETRVENTPDIAVKVKSDYYGSNVPTELVDETVALFTKILGAKPTQLHPHLTYPFRVRIDFMGCNNLSACIIEVDKLVGNEYDYFATISGTGKMDGTSDEWEYELAEYYYPNHGSEFSAEQTAPYDSETQINIFGKFKTLSGAIRSLKSKGNSTYNHRKPIEIYV